MLSAHYDNAAALYHLVPLYIHSARRPLAAEERRPCFSAKLVFWVVMWGQSKSLCCHRNITMYDVSETEVCIITVSLDLARDAVKLSTTAADAEDCWKFNLTESIYSWFGQCPEQSKSNTFSRALLPFQSKLEGDTAAFKHNSFCDVLSCC